MAGLLALSVHDEVNKLTRKMDALAAKQIPFATALALTGVARQVQQAETLALPTALDKKPTPFTRNAFGVIAARKTNQTAIIFAKDKQAAYLAPSEFGGQQILGNKKALINPKNIALNQYHNIPQKKIAQLLAQPNVFSGAITFHKSGQTISGIWMRPDTGERRNGGHGSKKNTHGITGGVRTGLKLLVRWSDGITIPAHFGYHDRAAMIVKKCFDKEFAKAIDKALATAK